MREELKQREAELEKSSEDKQQLSNQVQNLKEGLQNLQNTDLMQVSLTGNTHFVSAGSPESEERGKKSTVSSLLFYIKVHFWVSLFAPK